MSGDVPTGDSNITRFIIVVAVSLLVMVALIFRDKIRKINTLFS